ncbi:MAG TPA: 16S rRNA (cytosine(1402)-N(4))-methyltransferase RsmH [Candidatus Dojkabacteria bacterium]|nr:16S rRNA (cytosine(1402)-N(4))-methyltransferase RsmH [Candidatus Dojkabacteria bacterium]
MNKTHVPVMLQETIEKLHVKDNGFYVDCTLGEGGHSYEIYKSLNADGNLLSIDNDAGAIDFVKGFYEETKSQNWQIVQGNFSKIDTYLKKYNRKPDGIIMDLGISSRQLEVETRGFSYIQEAQPLDMRMDTNLGVTAKDLLYALNESELTKLFRKYGEEEYASKIARNIKKYLEKGNEINTVGDLVSIIYKVLPSKEIHDSKHPARRVFQALRIAVNDELNSLETGLQDCYDALNKGGRLVVITFHSLEDRIVKKFFESNGNCITKKPITPRYEEILSNSRAHSAKLRVTEKK